MRGRGLKLVSMPQEHRHLLSPPMRGHGLKRLDAACLPYSSISLPS